MEYSSKFAILSQELCRRLFNCKSTVTQARVNEIIDEFSLKLLRSGYSIPQVRQIFISGMRAFQSKVRVAKESGQNLHRSAAASLKSRIKRKVFEKVQWFRGPKNKKEIHKKSTNNTRNKRPSNKPVSTKVKSVMFVAHSPSSKLVKLLRKEEHNLSVITGYRVKYQERSGDRLRRILCKVRGKKVRR